MDANTKTVPGMPTIEELSKLDTVGVLKSS
jgi:hypothetical protein